MAAFLAVIAALGARMAWLQTVDADRLVAYGRSQRFRTIDLPAERGTIFDRAGRELAVSVPQMTIWADPARVDDPSGLASRLAAVVGVDAGLLERRLSDPDARFVYVARKVPPDVAERVEALGEPAVGTYPEERRFLPAGDLAAGIIGLVGIDNEGLEGLELAYDEVLRGSPGRLELELGLGGDTIPVGEHHLVPARRGADVVLSLDRTVQFEAERRLIEQVEATGADGGTVVISRPGTGEVLAIANVRRDPDTGEVGVSDRNDAALRVFEPGSVLKAVTVAGALSEGLVGPGTVLEVPDHLRVADHTFTDHDPHPTELWSVADILRTSSNVGTILIARQLGADRLHDWLRAFGFGTPSGLRFPGESGGLLADPSTWSGTSIGTIPIGQGVSVTALQLVEAYNILANGGIAVPLRLVLEPGERADEPHRVVSATTARQMREMLTGVVDAGTGTAAAIEGYSVAGKTGTARKPAEGARGYEAGAFVSSFVGFVPAEAPEVSIVVVIDEPRTSIYGGTVAAPVFSDLARFTLRTLAVPPLPRDSGDMDPPTRVRAPATPGPGADAGDGR